MTAPIPPSAPGAPVQPGTPFSAAVAGGAMGKDEFVKLLVAQMTHQDPLNPLDGQEMAAQLAQFSSVEQLMNIGQKLDAQAAGMTAMLGVVNNSAAMGLLGRDITVGTEQIVVGTSATESVTVDVPSGGPLTVRITDANGNMLRNETLGYAGAGERVIELADITEGLAPGTYGIEVLHSAGGTTNPLPTRMVVRADGVRFDRDGTMITSGPLAFPIGTIIAIAAAR